MDDMKKTDYRVEKDSIGVKDIPEEVYYGVQTLRAAENFHITGLNMHPETVLHISKKRQLLQTVKSVFLRRKKHRLLYRLVMRLLKENFMMIL